MKAASRQEKFRRRLFCSEAGMSGATRHLILSNAMLALLMLPTQAAAQTETPRSEPSEFRLGYSPHERHPSFRFDRVQLDTRDLVRPAQPVQDARRRDSLANGILIGAAIGAASLGTFGAILCKAMQEPDGPSCADDIFRLAAIGGAIGAGGGLVVDAALTRQSGVRVSVGIRF